MIELIFILIGIGITVIVLLLPSYTPEQVGSKKMIARRVTGENDSGRTLDGGRSRKAKNDLQPRRIGQISSSPKETKLVNVDMHVQPSREPPVSER